MVFDDVALTITVTDPVLAGITGYTITATDPYGESDTHVFNFDIQMNNAPSSPITFADKIFEIGVAENYVITTNYTDPEGDSPINYSVDCSGSNGLTFTDNADETSTLAYDGSNNPGTVTCVITADDTFTNGQDTTQSFDVTFTSRPVQADGTDDATLLLGVPFTYTASAGDADCTDPDGDAVTQVAVDTGENDLTNGWLSFDDASDTFSGTPDVIGSFPITITCSDGTFTDTGTFTLTVSDNQDPVWTDIVPDPTIYIPG